MEHFFPYFSDPCLSYIMDFSFSMPFSSSSLPAFCTWDSVLGPLHYLHSLPRGLGQSQGFKSYLYADDFQIYIPTLVVSTVS